METSLVGRLCEHRTLRLAPREQIEWIAEHGSLRHLDAATLFYLKDGPVDELHVVLNGHLSIYVDRGAGRRKIMEWRGGDVTGVMPYSRMTSAPGDVIAEEPTDVFIVPRELFPALIRECHELTAVLVHVMVDRARHFNSSFLHDEKLVSLGKLAAGLAHELNNPASAIARSAALLLSTVGNTDIAARTVGSVGLTGPQIVSIERLRETCLTDTAHPVLSPLELEAREESIAKWLEEHHAAPMLADALSDTIITLDMLDRLAESVQGQALNATLDWIAAGFATRRLVQEIQVSASRIYDLVAAIKGFTQVDREAAPEPVDIKQGLANSLVVLGGKARGKQVGIAIHVEDDLPRVSGFAGELNQVWSNLIDNALDAVRQEGRVELTAKREGEAVVVRVVDDGPGVPDAIRDSIFDPFFTTKPVGQGTGLGLDIVRRLIQRHNGQIELDSRPGRTEFRVTLPLTGVRGRVGAA